MIQQYNDAATLIFLHIPKTAGTSLRMTMLQQFPAEATYQYYRSQECPPVEELPLTQRAAIRLMSSHAPFGTHDSYLTPPIHYVTMLRNPLERLISQYHYSKMREGVESTSGYRDLLQYAATLFETGKDNLQVRQLSGQGGKGVVTDRSYEAAIANLTAPIMTFGLVERYAESLLFMSRQFGWQGVRLTRKNVTQRPYGEGIDQRTRHAILQQHRYDLALYHDAIRLFNHQVANAGITPLHVSKLYVSTWTDKTERWSLKMRRTLKQAVRRSRRLVFSNLRKIVRRVRQPNRE